MTTKLCLKCGKEFQQRQEIDGKKFNLQRRKFCLICSPFKAHNTRDIRDLKPRTYFHSRNYPSMSDEQKKLWNKKTQKNTQQRRIERKIKLIKLYGGKCSGCGYDKNYAALHFHHVDPSKKEFSLSSNKIAARAWDALLKEACKCVILCGNCHAEYHSPQCEMVGLLGIEPRIQL